MADQQDRQDTRYYAAYGISAYGLWGLIPLYFKTVADVAPTEVLAHRAIWSFAVLVVAVGLLGRSVEVQRNLRSLRLMLMLGLSATTIAANWLMFIYSVASGQVLQSSLGYFISPLVCVGLGVVCLRERLSGWQTLAVGLAAVGLLVMACVVGQMPWIALTLAVTSASHVLIRRIVPVDGLVSLTVETIVMLPIALAYLGYRATTATLTGNTPAMVGQLMLAGPVTTIPFLFYGFAVKRLQLSTMGILEYLTPSLQLLLAVVAFNEPFSTVQLVSFACVWMAIAIYTADSYRIARRTQWISFE
jgi:chloramphenicol-sensitive protein RarD